MVGSMSLTSVDTLRLMVPGSSTVGVNPSWIPNFFQVTLSAPRAEESGTGSSPPARNRASWPLRVASVGSASVFASPFDSRRLSVTLNGNGVADPKKSWKVWPRGALGKTGGWPAPPVPGTARFPFRKVPRPLLGPTIPPTWAPFFEPPKRFTPISFNPVRETSAKRTCSWTWCVPPTVIRFATCLA